MMPEDFARFETLIRKLEDVYSKKFTDDAMQAYWRALKDLPYEQISERVNTHIRYSKFVPKPVELRPREERPKETSAEVDGAFQATVKKNIEHWEERKGEVGFKWALLEAYAARLGVQDEPGTPAYLDKLEFATNRARAFLDAGLAPGNYRLARYRAVSQLLPQRLREALLTDHAEAA